VLKPTLPPEEPVAPLVTVAPEITACPLDLVFDRVPGGRDAHEVAFPTPKLYVRYYGRMPLLAKLIIEMVLRFEFLHGGMWSGHLVATSTNQPGRRCDRPIVRTAHTGYHYTNVHRDMEVPT